MAWNFLCSSSCHVNILPRFVLIAVLNQHLLKSVGVMVLKKNQKAIQKFLYLTKSPKAFFKAVLPPGGCHFHGTRVASILNNHIYLADDPFLPKAQINSPPHYGQSWKVSYLGGWGILILSLMEFHFALYITELLVCVPRWRSCWVPWRR